VSVGNIADRAAGYGIPGEVVDRQDAAAVYRAVERVGATHAPMPFSPTLENAVLPKVGDIRATIRASIRWPGTLCDFAVPPDRLGRRARTAVS